MSHSFDVLSVEKGEQEQIWKLIAGLLLLGNLQVLLPLPSTAPG